MMRLKRFVQSVLYAGSKYSCPVCEDSFRKFLTYGKPARENAMCPGCGVLERHRLLWLFLRDETGLFREKLRVLHFAPEVAFLERLSKLANLFYVPADLAPSADIVKKIDITKIPSADNFYDCIICCHVLEHVPNDQRALKEIFRVLRPDGFAILQVPIKGEKTFGDPDVFAPEDRQRVFGNYDHVRSYGQDYKKRLEQSGFKVEIISYADRFDEKMIKRYVLPRDDIYFCSK